MPDPLNGMWQQWENENDDSGEHIAIGIRII